MVGGRAAVGDLAAILLFAYAMVVVVLVTLHQFLLKALRVLSVLASLVGNDIWWTCIFELISDLVKMSQE